MSAEDTPKDYSESPINLEYFYTAGFSHDQVFKSG